MTDANEETDARDGQRSARLPGRLRVQDSDGVGPQFDRYVNGDVSWVFEGSHREVRMTQASADYMRAQ